MTQITVKRLWKEYDTQVVLENVSLHVGDHEFVTIIGASGCGKTTFLRMLLGVETPSRGEFLIDGRPLAGEPGPDRGIVFQRYSLFPHMTVLQNLLLGLELQGAPALARLFGARRRAAIDRAEELLEAVGLVASSRKYPAQLSGGMQQRLSIAQSVICQPKILLLDEPFGALDPGVTADMHELILKLWNLNKMTIVMVTHDVRESFHLGTRLLVFDRVRIDPQAPDRYGATITYDIPLKGHRQQALPSLIAG
jgi:NitT/TauT family transport system ATP-binding protein